MINWWRMEFEPATIKAGSPMFDMQKGDGATWTDGRYWNQKMPAMQGQVTKPKKKDTAKVMVFKKAQALPPVPWYYPKQGSYKERA